MSDLGENVVLLPVITTLNHDPDFVLRAAVGKLEEVVIVGKTIDGDEFFASSHSDGGIALWHLKRAEHKLMRLVDELVDGDD